MYHWMKLSNFFKVNKNLCLKGFFHLQKPEKAFLQFSWIPLSYEVYVL